MEGKTRSSAANNTIMTIVREWSTAKTLSKSEAAAKLKE
jgi:hypothetical protein